MATYVIGDIHGRSDYLTELVELRLPVKKEDTLVFIGDYVDRGPDSCGVIEALIELKDRRKCIFLRGNHEDMFMGWLGLETVGYPVPPSMWLNDHGGLEALQSYGLQTSGFLSSWKMKRMQGNPNVIPESHVEFLRETLLQYEDEHAYYVHAGFRPEVPPAEQKPEDLMTIRQEWIDSDYAFDKLVVHGHTPTPYDGGELKTRILPHRINVDTGCGRHPKGFLSAVRLPDLELFSVGEPGQSVPFL